ncbi:MAG: nitroreductase [Fimbriimonadaceae bacterium]|nr:nitroreductase [Fimbriimonadaceae bacterium]
MNSTTTVGAESLMAAIAQRRSMGLSRMSDAPVPQELIETMLEAANWAPSHKDTEPWRFTIFSGEGRGHLADFFEAAYRSDHAEPMDPVALQGYRDRAFAAPVWIAIAMEPGRDSAGNPLVPEIEEVMAVSGAVLNLHLMASSLGLAGMWHSKGVSVHPAVAAGLGLREPRYLLGFFMLGWPNCEWMSGERRPIMDKVRWVTE